MLYITDKQQVLIAHQSGVITIADIVLKKSSCFDTPCSYFYIDDNGHVISMYDKIKKFESFNSSKGILINLIELGKYAKKNHLKIDGTTFDYVLKNETHNPKITEFYCKNILKVVKYSEDSYSVNAHIQGNGSHKVGQSLIIAGFPGVGKSTFTNKYASKDFIIHDSDSSFFSWEYVNGVKTKNRNKNFPFNYINHIVHASFMAEINFVSSHKSVRDGLNSQLIPFILFYPDHSLKSIYIDNYRTRYNGTDQAFANMMETKFDEFVNEIEEEINDPNSLYHQNERSIYVRLTKSYLYIDQWIDSKWMSLQMDRYCRFIDSPIFPNFKE